MKVRVINDSKVTNKNIIKNIFNELSKESPDDLSNKFLIKIKDKLKSYVKASKEFRDKHTIYTMKYVLTEKGMECQLTPSIEYSFVCDTVHVVNNILSESDYIWYYSEGKYKALIVKKQV